MELKSRFLVLRQIFTSRLAKWLFIAWAGLGSYDLFVSQLLPDDTATEMPKAWKVVAMTSGWLSWQWWVFIFAGLIVFLSLEYAFRITRKLNRTNANQAGSLIAENKPQTKPNPFDLLAKECQDADATHIKLTRKPQVFVMHWVYYLDKLRRERNTHDIVNLFNLIGGEIHSPGRGNANVGMEEVLFTLKCLAIRGYITLEKSDYGHCSPYENQNIKFNAKYDEFIRQLTFKETAGGYSVYW